MIWHDYTLVGLDLNQNPITLSVRNATGVQNYRILGVEKVIVKKGEDWGPSQSVLDFLESDGELTLHMQSGTVFRFLGGSLSLESR